MLTWSTVIFLLLAIAALAIALISVFICLRKNGEKKKRKEMEAHLEGAAPVCEKAFAEISEYYKIGHFITESERICLVNKYHDLAGKTSKLEKYFDNEDLLGINTVRRFNKAMSDTVGFKKINNDRFIENQLKIHSDFFDTVLAYPLDQQQREAIVSLEDNVLVISSAGSGKTMTTVGKVRYLIDKQGIDPAKILLITFTRKAAESLSERLGEKSLKCVTFHKLALDIISKSTGIRPSLTSSDFSVQVYHQLLEGNRHFRAAVADYILRSRYMMKDQFEYSSREEYMKDRKRYGVQAYHADMDGRPVFCKSDEESQVADFLGSRGIRFRYEEKYEIETADSEHRQYVPDFSIYFIGTDKKEHRAYLEHFAVNEYGHCPKWFGPGEEKKYLEDRNWKRNIHNQNGTVLLETSSGDFHKGDIFDKLEKQLIRIGVGFEPSRNNASHELEKQEQNIIDMLTSFNFLMKSKAMTIRDVKSQGLKGKDSITVNDIVEPFIEAYKKYEEKLDEIDFTDAIIEATALCNNGHKPKYDYILVDEFQDISIDRYKFLQALRSDSPLTKIFCVGDDWQSIYRFAGSDMALFKRFSDYFGYTKECRMETTYRFGEPLIQKSSKFILTNTEQKEKDIRPFREDVSTNIDFIPTYSRSDVAERVRTIVESIPADKDIYLLGRYSFDVNILNKTFFDIKDKNGRVSVSYEGREMTFMTVHQSKGLESDYVILLNCNAGSLGFPADIADNPILKYVLSEPDGYEFGEERRVFYVGITRAKKYTYVLYDNNHPSPFISEFIDTTNISETEAIPEKELCPKCRCGRIVSLKKGVAKNGNPYYVVGCTNRKFGCDYQDTVFVNLNRNKIISSN